MVNSDSCDLSALQYLKLRQEHRQQLTPFKQSMTTGACQTEAEDFEESVIDDLRSLGSSSPVTTLRLEIPDFSAFNYTISGCSEVTKYGAPSLISNVLWRIVALPFVETDSTERFLSFFIDCCPETQSEAWSCEAVVEFRLLSQKPGYPNETRKARHFFTAKASNFGYPCFISWAEAIDENLGYIKDNFVILEATVTTSPPKFITSNNGIHKDTDKWIKLAQFQLDRNQFDLAMEAVNTGIEYCKKTGVEPPRRMLDQREYLVGFKLANAIRRMERAKKITNVSDSDSDSTNGDVASSPDRLNVGSVESESIFNSSCDPSTEKQNSPRSPIETLTTNSYDLETHDDQTFTEHIGRNDEFPYVNQLLDQKAAGSLTDAKFLKQIESLVKLNESLEANHKRKEKELLDENKFLRSFTGKLKEKVRGNAEREEMMKSLKFDLKESLKEKEVLKSLLTEKDREIEKLREEVACKANEIKKLRGEEKIMVDRETQLSSLPVITVPCPPPASQTVTFDRSNPSSSVDSTKPHPEVSNLRQRTGKHSETASLKPTSIEIVAADRDSCDAEKTINMPSRSSTDSASPVCLAPIGTRPDGTVVKRPSSSLSSPLISNKNQSWFNWSDTASSVSDNCKSETSIESGEGSSLLASIFSGYSTGIGSDPVWSNVDKFSNRISEILGSSDDSVNSAGSMKMMNLLETQLEQQVQQHHCAQNPIAHQELRQPTVQPIVQQQCQQRDILIPQYPQHQQNQYCRNPEQHHNFQQFQHSHGLAVYPEMPLQQMFPQYQQYYQYQQQLRTLPISIGNGNELITNYRHEPIASIQDICASRMSAHPNTGSGLVRNPYCLMPEGQGSNNMGSGPQWDCYKGRWVNQ